MDAVITQLKRLAGSREAEIKQEIFELLAVACSNCCQESSGGNRDCPPPPKIAL